MIVRSGDGMQRCCLLCLLCIDHVDMALSADHRGNNRAYAVPPPPRHASSSINAKDSMKSDPKAPFPSSRIPENETVSFADGMLTEPMSKEYEAAVCELGAVVDDDSDEDGVKYSFGLHDFG